MIIRIIGKKFRMKYKIRNYQIVQNRVEVQFWIKVNIIMI